MKIDRKLLPWIPAAVCCAAFLVYFAATRGIGDHTAPEITVPEGALQVSVYGEERELLRGVTARDEEDGDVTEQMVVESISGMDEQNRAVITYAAFDQAGNVSKARRPLEYIDYVRPRFTLSAPLIFQEGTAFDVFEAVGAEDSVDGDLSEQIKGTLVSGGKSVDRAGKYEVEFRVTNSLGDTIHVTLPVEVVSDSLRETQPHLKTYLTYVGLGEEFEPRDYLARDTRGWPLKISSDVDTSVPGTYTVTYTDENGEHYGKTRLIVVVEE